MSTAKASVALLLVLAALAGCVGGSDGSGDAASEGTVDNQPSRGGAIKDFSLYMRQVSANLYPNATAQAWLFSANEEGPFTLPGPTIRATEGDTVRITFYVTGAPMPHTIHWHGLHVPWDMDGVPFVSQLPIGDTSATGGPSHPEAFFTYEFKLVQSGTYFYHCHVDTAHHTDMGMYGPLIIDPADKKQDPPYDRDYTLMLDEWDKSHVHGGPNASNTQTSRDPNQAGEDAQGSIQDTYTQNPSTKSATQDPRDWYPAQYPAYYPDYDTYLINGKAFPSTETLFMKTGDVVRLRVINTGFESHALHLHGHHMYITHQDGYLVPLLNQLGDASGIRSADELHNYAQPVDVLNIGPGQRFDVYVFGTNPGPWMLHDHISTNVANDNIAPGGMMTVLCYEDGWSPLEGTELNPCALGDEGGPLTSGDLVASQRGALERRWL